MSYENFSYYEASEKVPPIENKRKKKEYQIQQEEFPPLSQQPQSEVVTIGERSQRNQEKRSTYSAQTQSQKKRRITQKQQEYDKEEYKKYLLRPDGREPQLEKSSDSDDSDIYRSNPENRRKEMETNTKREIEHLTNILPLEYRQDIINYMTQLMKKMEENSLNLRNWNTYGRRPIHSPMELQQY